jgi:BA14K-like protein
MSKSIRVFAGAALLASVTAGMMASAAAAPIGQPAAMAWPASNLAEQVYWRGRGWGWGGGAFVGGLAAGALIGGAIAAPYYYGSPYYYGPRYAPAPAYAPPPEDDSTAYCAQHYRSYDPNTGTFLGNDGRRHPCP